MSGRVRGGARKGGSALVWWALFLGCLMFWAGIFWLVIS